ncbi:sulfatase-like hydrolase/transferase [Negadavirga shengliensis]|uniref:Sulfatase-like hydrolase/transferase n=1 Tax=Negadavirga shengliensis TaxID=1389218 RepID=A0ABV9T010_9BACT
MPHVPLFASEEFRGRERGLYGDVVEEVDWGVGQVQETLTDEELDENTFVVFTSDNGPWVVMDQPGGSAGLFFGAKATSYEGGVREPAIFWMPGTVKPGVISKMGGTLDLLPTISNMAGTSLPEDRLYNAYDLTPVLTGEDAGPRKELIYYHGTRVFAARIGAYEAVYYSNNPQVCPGNMQKLDKPRLFNLSVDPSERFDLAEEHPGEIKIPLRDTCRHEKD